MGAQFGSKRQPDKARRELEGPNVVPRKQKRPPERCQDAPKNPNLEALAPILERKCDPNGCHDGKKQENVRFAKPLKKTQFFQCFYVILGYLEADKP